MDQAKNKGQSMLKKAALYTALFFLWIALSVPIGGLVLAAKQALGLNLFSHTGYHAFKSCLVQEVQKTTE